MEMQMFNARVMSVVMGVPLTLMLVVLAVDAASPRNQQQPPASRPSQRSETSSKAGNKYGLSTPKPRPSGSVRIATYNTLNLFDHVDDPAMQGEFDDIKTPSSNERCAK